MVRETPGPATDSRPHLTERRDWLIFNHMVEYQQDLDVVFGALADPTRRAILQRLTKGNALVTELAEPFEMSLAAVSKHLQVLERAGLVYRQVIGREHHCALNPKPMETASDWLEHYRAFWETRLDALEQFIITKRRNERRAPKGGKKTDA